MPSTVNGVSGPGGEIVRRSAARERSREYVAVTAPSPGTVATTASARTPRPATVCATASSSLQVGTWPTSLPIVNTIVNSADLFIMRYCIIRMFYLM